MKIRYNMLFLAALTAAACLTAGCGGSAEDNMNDITVSVSGSSDAAGAAVPLSDIDMEQAKAIALEHAGAAENEVTFTKQKYDGGPVNSEYDIEFIYNGAKYEYEINAADGSVTEFSSEIISAPQTAVPDGGLITAQEAESIALEYAGLTAEDAGNIRSKLDYDDGIAEYEVEFKHGGYEYEFEINASNGNIIKSEIDRDDR